jgi:hypothetical protein
MKRMLSVINRHPGLLDATIWAMALVALAIFNPSTDAHFTVCPLALAGFEHCPGCGLGRSISHLLHGAFTASLHAHWLGIPATLLLFWRIISVLHKVIKNQIAKS